MFAFARTAEMRSFGGVFTSTGIDPGAIQSPFNKPQVVTRLAAENTATSSWNFFDWLNSRFTDTVKDSPVHTPPGTQPTVKDVVSTFDPSSLLATVGFLLAAIWITKRI